MNELEKLLAKPKEVTIGEAKFNVYPLTVADLSEVANLADKNSDIRSKATIDLIKKSLKKSFPDATDEHIKDFDLRYLNDFLGAVFEVSGLQVDEKKLSEMTATYSA